MGEGKGLDAPTQPEALIEEGSQEKMSLDDEDYKTGPTYVPEPVKLEIDKDKDREDIPLEHRDYREGDDSTRTIDITMGALQDKTLEEFTPKDFYYHLLHSKDILEKANKITVKEPENFTFDMVGSRIRIIIETGGNDYEITLKDKLGGDTLNSSFKAMPTDPSLPPLFVKFVDITVGGKYEKARDKRFLREYILQELDVLSDVDIEGIPDLKAAVAFTKDDQPINKIFKIEEVDGEQVVKKVNVPDKFIVATSFEKEGKPFEEFLIEQRDRILQKEGLEFGEFSSEFFEAVEKKIYPMLKEKILEEVAIIKALHEKGYVHRDIKPENLLNAALIDFGLAMKIVEVPPNSQIEFGIQQDIKEEFERFFAQQSIDGSETIDEIKIAFTQGVHPESILGNQDEKLPDNVDPLFHKIKFDLENRYDILKSEGMGRQDTETFLKRFQEKSRAYQSYNLLRIGKYYHAWLLTTNPVNYWGRTGITGTPRYAYPAQILVNERPGMPFADVPESDLKELLRREAVLPLEKQDTYSLLLTIYDLVCSIALQDEDKKHPPLGSKLVENILKAYQTIMTDDLESMEYAYSEEAVAILKSGLKADEELSGPDEDLPDMETAVLSQLNIYDNFDSSDWQKYFSEIQDLQNDTLEFLKKIRFFKGFIRGTISEDTIQQDYIQKLRKVDINKKFAKTDIQKKKLEKKEEKLRIGLADDLEYFEEIKHVDSVQTLLDQFKTKRQNKRQQ